MTRKRKRQGLSLLELIIASSMLAMLLASISVVIRAGRESWEAHEGDYVRVEAAHSVLRHIVRQIRAAEAVTEITVATNNSGRLGLRMPNGEIHLWAHDSTNNLVNYGVATPNNLLAPEITGLRFTGRRADGTTAAATAADVQCLEIEVTIQLPRETNGQRIVTSWAWVRSW
ncbi:MAG: prepilin-type N-terminal cleavage/methylation domain-containing protein [Planctomycetes bacterium]|nr:prepilin-type N-terminal cleavage/methylation domain-containing protein [Planctomycetota bacterium]